MTQNLHLGFRLGGFRIEPLAGEIRSPQGSRHLQPKAMDVLVCLAERAGELVERETLLARVWGRPTSEEVLTRCISELRNAFDDDRARPEFIQTVPKRGYRLLKPIVSEDRKAGAGTAASAMPAPQSNPPPASAALASVAVLPFENHSSPEHGYLADAFASELHRTLARVDRLRVASRRSAFALNDSSINVRQIGAALNVRYVLSGSLQYDGTTLRVITALDDAESGMQIWAQSYDRKSRDILTVEREIAEAVVASFTTQQQREELRWAFDMPTADLNAWGLVQKARSLALRYTTETLASAIAPIERAIELDPDYAAAHATHGTLLAERLINGLSEDEEGDSAAAIRAAERAQMLAPRDPFILKMAGVVWAHTGDHRRSASCLRNATSYAPFDFGTWGYLGWPLTASGETADLEELRAIIDRILSMEPQHHGVPFWLYHRSVAEACSGDWDEAKASIEGALELQPGFALGRMHYASVLGHLDKTRAARAAVAACLACNPAMTVRHFASLVARLSSSPRVIAARTTGLRDLAD